MSINAKPWEGAAGGGATVPDASETTKGKIRIATSAEATTGTDDLTAMTPLTVKERIDAALVGGVEYKGSYTGQSLVTAEKGDMYISSGNQTLGGISLTNGDHIIFNQDASDPVTGSMFDKIDNTDQVTSVNGQTNIVSLGIGDLNNVTISGGGADGDFVRYDSGDSRWENVTAASINVGDFNDDATYQLRDAGLTSIAGLTTSADKMIYATASDTYAVTDLTAAGRALLDDADATAQRTTLGLGTAATSDTGDFLASTAALNDLSDVTISSVSNGQVISYNSTSGEWENSTPASGGATDLNGLSDVTITSASSGQILRNNGSGQFVNVALSIVDDPSPQLGGALDVNGNAITSASNGNVTINPDGTGDISVGADIIPDADATHTIGDEDNRFISLYSDVNGAIRFKAKNDQGSAITKGQVVYIKGVSGDVPTVGLARANSASTMPGFGLAIANANDQAEVQIITFGNLTAYNTTTYSLSVGDTVYVSAATAGALTNSAPASETNLIQNIGKVIRASATEGIIKVGGAGRSAATPNLNDGKIFLGNASNQAVSTALSSINLTSFNDDLGSTYQPLDAQLTDVAGLTPADGAFIVGNGANFITESGATARTSLGAIAELSDDTTPQLGGNLDTNGQDIVTTSNADLDLAPNGTGVVVIRGNTNSGSLKLNCENNSHGVTIKGPPHSAAATYTLTLPNNDGDADQVLKTDGSGVLSWVDQSGGGGAAGWTYSAITADPANAQAGYHYSCTGTFTITLPTTGVSAGEEIRIKNMGTGTITLDPQTSNIDGATTDYVMDVQYGALTLVSTGTHWEII